MSSEDGGSPPPEEMVSLDQILERFVTEVEHVSRDTSANNRRLESQLRTQFQLLRRDLNRTVTRELDVLRAELAPSSLQPRFAPFRRLPPEVRARIWTLALPSRFVELRATYMQRPGPPRPGVPTNPVVTTNRLPPPAIAHVCHEARQVALRYGRLRRTKAVEEPLSSPWARPSLPGGPPPPPASNPFLSSLYVTSWSWFSPEHDWLKVPGTGPPIRIDTAPGTIEALQGEAHNILIRRPASAIELERVLERIALGQCPAMKTLGIVVGHELIRPRRSLTLETRLFGSNGPFRFVDLKDAEEVTRVARIFRADEAEAKHAEVWETHAQAVNDGLPWSTLLNGSGWSSVKDEELMVAWIILKHRRSPTTVNLSTLVDVDDMEFVNDEHPWIKAELDAMPEIRLMYLFILDDLEGRDLKKLYGSSFTWRMNSIAVA